ncbi:PadR family transcriptional regulator [Traorella massiliensis]|uniref:PadR family transcriptional regulator n=1 Tax=Traorella massiliensis TaxID=1903263 RepID=UPI0008F95E80|nr:PadR family transcriptional regulator [Traorella massiliensis]
MSFQVGSTILDACVLSVLRKKDTYGYQLNQEIKEKLGVSESTLYPVLRRLQKEGLLTTYDEAVMGRNRRYYRLTEKGKEQSTIYYKEWKEFSGKIEEILKGEDDHE